MPRSREIAAPPPTAPSSIPQVRLEKVMVSQSFNQGLQSGGDGTREGTIGEYCGAPFFVCLSRTRPEQTDITSFMVSVAAQDAVGQSHRMYVTV